MITAGTDAISNSAPTRVTMAFLGMAQAGVVLMLQRPLAGMLVFGLVRLPRSFARRG